jgi:BTB/POZ domain
MCTGNAPVTMENGGKARKELQVYDARRTPCTTFRGRMSTSETNDILTPVTLREGDCKRAFRACLFSCDRRCLCLLIPRSFFHTTMNEPTPVNHKSLYFRDGNIAIVAPCPPSASVVFRVHQSFLSQVSSVFESMFSLNSDATQEMRDGVPVVYMQDPASEVEILIRAIYAEV